MFGVPRITRGHLEQARPVKSEDTSGSTTTTKTEQRLGLAFLFNPSELTLQWNIREDLHTAGAIADDAGAAFGAESQAFNLTLLFDRTYEVWQGNRNTSRNSPGSIGGIGVQEDVWQFERMLGLRTKGGPLAGSPLRQAPLLFYPNIPADKAFTSDTEELEEFPLEGAWAPLLGYINSASVTYTHFSHKMIPTRAVISMSFLRYYVPPDQGLTVSTDALTDVLPASIGPAAQDAILNTSPPNVIAPVPKGV